MPVQTTTVGTYLRTDLYYSYNALRAYEDAYVHGDNAGYLLSYSTPTVTIKAYDTFEQVYKGYTLQNAWARNVFSSYFEDWTGNAAVSASYRVDPVKIQFSVLMFENQSATVDQWSSLRYVSTGTGLAPLSFSPGSAFVTDTPTSFISAHTNGTLGTVSSWLNGKAANPVYEIADASGTSVMTAAQAATLSTVLPTISVKTGTTAVVTDTVGNLVSFLNGASKEKILDAGIKIALSSGVSPITAANAAVILGESDSLAAGQVINITDVPQAIGLHLAALKAGVSKIGVINVNGEIPLTHADFLSSGTLFTKFNGTYSYKVQNASVSNVATLNTDSSVSTIEIVDTAGAVESNLVGLRAAQGKISAISLSNAATTRMELLVTQVVDNADLLGSLVDTNVIAVRGTSTQVAASIDQLGRLASQIHSVELAAGATPLALTASQTISHLSLIEKITSAYSLAITDLSENVAANLTALNAQIAKISTLTLSDINSAPLVIDYAQRDAFISLAGKIAWPEGHGWENRVVRVEGVTLAQAQEIADLFVTNKYKVKVGIVDTAANLESGAALLRSLSVDQDAIEEIQSLDASASIDYQVYQSVGNLSGGLFNILNVEANDAQAVLLDADVQEITLRDTANNLSSVLPSLVGQESKIQSIALSDTASISITVPSDTSALTTLYNFRGLTSKFSQAYGIHLEGVSPYDLDQILRNNSDVVTIGVEGRSYALGPMLTELHHWGSRIETIEITDAGSVVDIGTTQLREQASTLDKMSGSFTFRVSVGYTNFDSTLWAQLDALDARVSSIRPSGSDFVRIGRSDFETYADTLTKVDNGVRFYVQGLSAQEALECATDLMVWGVQITDTASNLSARADELQNLASSRSGFYPIAITQSDAGVPLVLNLEQASLYERIFIRFETPVAIRVVDTSANISARLEGLYEQRARISEVIVLDGATSPVTIAASEFNDYGAQLSKIIGNFSLKLTHATASQVTSLSNDARFSSFEVWDNVTNISTTLDQLLALGDRLTAVRYTHSSFSPIEIEADKVELYRPVLNKFIDGYYLNVEKVKASAVASLLAQSGINRITVEDTASNFVTYLDSLVANAGRIDYVGIVGSSVMDVGATQAIQNSYMLSYWVLQNGPPGMVLNIVDAAMNQVSTIRSYFPRATIQIVDTSSNIINNLYELSWVGDSLSQIIITDNVSTLSMTASNAEQFAAYSDKFVGNIKIRISDTAYNVNQKLDSLTELGSQLESIDLIGSSSSLSMSIDQFMTASNVLSKFSDDYTVALSGTQAQLFQHIERLAVQVEKIKSIHLVDVNRSWSGSVSEAKRYADLLTKINLDGLNLVDSASQLSYLDFTTLASRNITLTPTILDSDVMINANDSLASIDLSRLVGSTFMATAINGGYGASIKVTQNGVTRTFTIVREVFNDIVIKGYNEASLGQDVIVEGSTNQETSTVNSQQVGLGSAFIAVPIENIEAIGISPDGRYLIIKASGVSTMVSYNSTLEFQNVKLSGSEISSQITPTPVFASNVNGSIQYVLPDLFTGPASLDLKYQLIDTTPNAVVTGSSENDFIKLADTNSLGKAVNGGGGNDVIDGGVGSTFISGGGGSNIFFLDGRASGISWSTITDFQLGQDKVTIWGWRKGVSKVALVDNSGGAAGFDGLTLHFENLLPSDAGAGTTNAQWNSITLSNRTLSDLGANSVEELNAQILAGNNPYLTTNQTVDDFGTHGYLHIA